MATLLVMRTPVAHLVEVHEPLADHVAHAHGGATVHELRLPHDVRRDQLKLDFQQGGGVALGDVLKVGRGQGRRAVKETGMQGVVASQDKSTRCVLSHPICHM